MRRPSRRHHFEIRRPVSTPPPLLPAPHNFLSPKTSSPQSQPKTKPPRPSRIVYAWENPGVPIDEVVDDVLRAFHHPAIRDDRVQIQREMFDTVRAWTQETAQRRELNQLLSSRSVKEGHNHILPPSMRSSGSRALPGGCGHGDGGHGKPANSLWGKVQTSRDQSTSPRPGSRPSSSGYGSPQSPGNRPPQPQYYAKHDAPAGGYGGAAPQYAGGGLAASYLQQGTQQPSYSSQSSYGSSSGGAGYSSQSSYSQPPSQGGYSGGGAAASYVGGGAPLHSQPQGYGGGGGYQQPPPQQQYGGQQYGQQPPPHHQEGGYQQQPPYGGHHQQGGGGGGGYPGAGQHGGQGHHQGQHHQQGGYGGYQGGGGYR